MSSRASCARSSPAANAARPPPPSSPSARSACQYPPTTRTSGAQRVHRPFRFCPWGRGAATSSPERHGIGNRTRSAPLRRERPRGSRFGRLRGPGDPAGGLLPLALLAVVQRRAPGGPHFPPECRWVLTKRSRGLRCVSVLPSVYSLIGTTCEWLRSGWTHCFVISQVSRALMSYSTTLASSYVLLEDGGASAYL